jgi:hypothetical protein
MNRPRRSLSLAWALCALPLAGQATAWTVELSAPGAGQPLRARGRAPAGSEWLVVFVRKEGDAEFESLTLEAKPDGSYAADIEVSLPPGTVIQYYGAMRGPGGVKTLPADAPAKFLSLKLPAEAPRPPAAKPIVHGPFFVDGNVSDLAHRKVAVAGEPTVQAAGQFRYALQQDEGDRHLQVGIRVVYSNQPAPNQARWSMGAIQAAYAIGNHRVQAGDLMAQESEFTLGPGGRRGLDYTYSGRALGGHLFALNSERQTGMDGLLWPVAGGGIYGGSLSTLWFGNTVRTRLILLTGRDDPATASNVSSAFTPPVREGSTGALVVDGRFLENRLLLSGEYARSDFTPDLTAPKADDQAWRLAGNWNQGPFSGHAGYRSVGREFGTVGVAFFVADRRVLDASLAWNRPSWGVSATSTEEHTNPTGQPDVNRALNQTQSLDLRVRLAPTATWRLALRTAHQEAETVANPYIPFTNSDRAGVASGFDLMLPPRLQLSFNAQYDHLRSTGSFPATGTSSTFSLGGTWNLGVRGRLSPNLSWSQILAQPGDQRTTVVNAFLNGELFLIPKTLSVLLNGGNSRTTLATGDSLRTAIAEGTLALTLDRYLQGRARGNLGLKLRYTHNPVPMAIADDNRAFLLLAFSY